MSLSRALSEFKWRWFFKAIAVIVGSILTILILLASPLDRPIYDMVLFHPTSLAMDFQMPACEMVAAKQVDFNTLNGTKLTGWYFKQPKSKYIVLFSHGNGGNVMHRIDNLQLLMRAGVSVFAYDYEGYGKSSGKPSVPNICDDAIAAYNVVNKDLLYPPDRIVLFGESLGTVVTGYLSSKVKCAGVILQSPLFSLPRRGREILPVLSIYPAWLYPNNGLDNSTVFSQAHAPLLIVAGTKDQMLPIAHADDLFAAACEPKIFVRIQGAGHTGDPKLTFAPEYAAALKVFLDRLDNKTEPASAPTQVPQPI
jgi:fermentation-respiration switch protein FrsA (DUF1100 family)